MDNILFFGLVIFVLVDLVIVFFVLSKRRRGGFTGQERKRYMDYWKKIKSNPDLRHAIMDADKLLDKLLQTKGYSGNLGEKLKKSGKVFGDLDGVWAAHKLRNRLAHELDSKLTDSEGRMALRQFERAFSDLGLK